MATPRKLRDRFGQLRDEHGQAAEPFTIVVSGTRLPPIVVQSVIREAMDWFAGGFPHRSVEIWSSLSSVLCVSGFAVGSFVPPECCRSQLACAELQQELTRAGLPVRRRYGTRRSVGRAELRAMACGWPVRYV